MKFAFWVEYKLIFVIEASNTRRKLEPKLKQKFMVQNYRWGSSPVLQSLEMVDTNSTFVSKPMSVQSLWVASMITGLYKKYRSL